MSLTEKLALGECPLVTNTVVANFASVNTLSLGSSFCGKESIVTSPVSVSKERLTPWAWSSPSNVIGTIKDNEPAEKFTLFNPIEELF